MSNQYDLGIPNWWKELGCVRKPSYACGEQVAMQDEIDKLRKELELAYSKLKFANDMIPCFDELMEQFAAT